MSTPALQSHEGQQVPHVSIPVLGPYGWEKIDTQAFFAGKTVVVFGLPGAYTPTCSTSHVPRYQELLPAFRAAGVDAVVCLSVNDTFVMSAWQRDEGATGLVFFPDGNGEFTAQLGMLVDKSAIGFGKRSWRYSMLVRDGRVDKMFVEPDQPGDPFVVSDADTMLKHLGATGAAQPDIFLLTKPFCGHCTRAKAALAARGLAFDEQPSTPRSLRAVSKSPTTPQVWIDGEHVGGADELIAWLAAHPEV